MPPVAYPRATWGSAHHLLAGSAAVSVGGGSWSVKSLERSEFGRQIGPGGRLQQFRVGSARQTRGRTRPLGQVRSLLPLTLAPPSVTQNCDQDRRVSGRSGISWCVSADQKCRRSDSDLTSTSDPNRGAASSRPITSGVSGAVSWGLWGAE